MASNLVWGTWSSATEMLANTALASLGDGSYKMGSTAWDNTTNKHPFGVITVDLGSLTTAAGAVIVVTLVGSLDGSAYATATDSVAPSSAMTQATFEVPIGTGAKYVISKPLPIIPYYYKLHFQNYCGASLASSGNSVKMLTGPLSI